MIIGQALLIRTLLAPFNYKAPGNAEKAQRPNPEIQRLLKQNNDVDLYDILSKKKLAKSIEIRDANKANQI